MRVDYSAYPRVGGANLFRYRTISQATSLKIELAYGDDSYDKQLKVLEVGVDILVGTTGRLIDYIKHNYVNMGAIQVAVLDKADRMFDLDFIKKISDGCSAECQTPLIRCTSWRSST